MRALLLTAGIGLLLALPAGAETPMTAEEFEAYTTGRTLTYSANGVTYGIEEYLPRRRVRWAFLDTGECQEGEWFPSGDMICFAYDGTVDFQCWQFFEEPTGLRARFMNDPTEEDLFETRNSPEPLLCRGPEIGV